MWQDSVITISQLIFSIALLPSVFGKDKPALASCLMTGSLVMVIAFTFTTLNLWFSAFSSFLNGTVWIILAYQKYFKR